MSADFVRNLWTHSVITCGPFPQGVETFEKASIDGETRGGWYLRQMLGAANIDGSRALHIATGTLSFQLERSRTCRATATSRSHRRSVTCSIATA